MSKGNAKKVTRNSYTPEFKMEAVERASAEGVEAVAAALHLHPNSIYQWRNKFGKLKKGVKKNANALFSELDREIRKLQEHLSVLQKTKSYLEEAH